MWPLTIKVFSVFPWVQVKVSITYEEIPPRCRPIWIYLNAVSEILHLESPKGVLWGHSGLDLWPPKSIRFFLQSKDLYANWKKYCVHEVGGWTTDKQYAYNSSYHQPDGIKYLQQKLQLHVDSKFQVWGKLQKCSLKIWHIIKSAFIADSYQWRDLTCHSHPTIYRSGWWCPNGWKREKSMWLLSKKTAPVTTHHI